MHPYHSLVPVSMAVYLPHLHCHMLLYTRSVEHVTVKVGEDQSHLGKQEVLECIASESTIYIYIYILFFFTAMAGMWISILTW